MAGGMGGGAGGGAGGTGYTGQSGSAGQNFGSPSDYLGGGGGGGAGYGTAGAGGAGGALASGGAAGTQSSRDGGDGGTSNSDLQGGGGGGAGFAGGTGSGSSYGATYLGGTGGDGGTGTSKITTREGTLGGSGGGGGAGGAGFYSDTSTTAIFANDAIGGAGGNGGNGGAGRGSGGDGGTGLQDGEAGAAITLSDGFIAKGGTGGSGSRGSFGGAGIRFTNTSQAASLVNEGFATGGTGGYVFGGAGGTGGAGVVFAGYGSTLANTGLIRGGKAGDGTGGVGAGGSGVTGAGLTIANNGSIIGGMGATQADAITFQSGANTLALGANSSIGGVVDIQSGTLTFDQSALSGAPTDASLANTIIGNGSIVKADGGTLTLSGSNSFSGGTTVSDGTLAVAADANLGDTSGGVTLSDGTLDTTTGFSSARAVTLGTANGTVQVDAGATTLSGVISGNGSLTKTGAGTLTLTGANYYEGNTILDAGTLAVSADGPLGGGTLVFQGGALETTATLRSGRKIQLTGAGTIQVDAGTTTTLNGSLSGAGVLTKTGAGTLALAGLNSSTGGLSIGAGLVDLQRSGGAGSGAITFAGTSSSPASLMLERTAQPNSGGTFGNTLTNFGADDELDLAGFTYSALDTVAVATTGSGATAVTTLTFTDNANDQFRGATEKFTLGGTPDTAYYVHDAGANGVVIDDTPCFVSGTRIGTAHGHEIIDVAVECLAVGDLVVTSSGAQRPIRWLGHRKMEPRRHPRPSEAQPIRISAHAFAPNRPARDLYVSPAHAICVDVLGEVLIPAGGLVNGSTITQLEVDAVTYWHVELDSHDVILAESLPAESYIEMGNRAFFVEANVIDLDAAPDAARRTHADFCRPFHVEGALFELVRARLALRAKALGWGVDASDPFAGLHLVVDGVRVDPVTRGLTARFLVPGGARDVWLVSATSRPCESADSIDDRHLGVCIGGLTIDDGFGACRALDLADPLISLGFHAHEGTHRWTAGRARLPAALWADVPDAVFLRVDLAGPALPRWVAPDAEAGLRTALVAAA